MKANEQHSTSTTSPASSAGKRVDWSQQISSQVASIKPSGIRAFFDIVAQRKDCISLGVGEPDFVSPPAVIESAIEALRAGYTHYTGNQGMPSLRRAVANYLEKEYELHYDPDTEILITVGVSEAVDLAVRAVMNAGDAFIYAQPSYVSYDPLIRLAGGEPLVAEAKFDNDFKLKRNDLDEVYQDHTKAVFLNYPSNPTGAGIAQEDLTDIANFLKENNLLAISDEIYAELTYEGEHTPIAALPDMKERSLLLGGFSKSFAMTGWRIGYAAGPAPWIEAMTKIHQFSMLCAPTLAQIAAEAALERALDDRDRMKEAYRTRRDTIVHGLRDLGFDCPMPQGAFYVFPRLPPGWQNAMNFAHSLLDAENVAIVPGDAFGRGYENYIRCSYATSLQDINIALERIDRFLKKH